MARSPHTLTPHPTNCACTPTTHHTTNTRTPQPCPSSSPHAHADATPRPPHPHSTPHRPYPSPLLPPLPCAARVQLSMSCLGCCCATKPANVSSNGKSMAGQDVSADVSSGEQNIAAGCISGDPHNPRFEMSDMEWVRLWCEWGGECGW